MVCGASSVKDAQGAQPEVEVDLLLPATRVRAAQRVHQLHAVTDGDVGDDATLAGQQRGDPGRGDPGVGLGTGRLGLRQPTQPGEAVRIPGQRHRRREIAVGAGQHPRQAGPEDVCADQHQQARRQLGLVV
jgi:hypothetical protein